MSTAKTRTISLLALCAALVALSGCGGGSMHSPTEVYVLIASNVKLPYWQTASEGFKRAAAELGVRYDIVGPETYDPKAQHEEFRRVLNRQVKPSGILISAAAPELVRPDIDAAIAQGIPVIAMDSDAPTSKRLMFIGTDNYRAGVMGAEVAAKHMQGKGNVAVFTMPEQTNLIQRLSGYQDVFARHPQIRIVQTVDIKGNAAVAFDATKELLASPKAPDAFVCMEAIACAQIADVLDRNKVTGKTVIAMDTEPDTLEWIKKGVITATVAQKPFTMAYLGLKLLDDLYHHKPQNLGEDWAQDLHSPVPAFVDTGSALVNKANLDKFAQSLEGAPAK
ncbi:MAG: substrate-binding domain-containing protein [Bryobacterales bacterium]|nr:substrate-binding domain-containing protein [Bryobacterales bacterium]